MEPDVARGQGDLDRFHFHPGGGRVVVVHHMGAGGLVKKGTGLLHQRRQRFAVQGGTDPTAAVQGPHPTCFGRVLPIDVDPVKPVLAGHHP